MRAQSLNLSHDNITPLVRVSTAAINSCHMYGHYWQIETWIFSDDPAQPSRQIIHGTCYSDGVKPFDYNANIDLCAKAERAHRHIAANLRQKFAPAPAPEGGE